MFCPQCGQQQVSGDVRFCSRCGFALNAVNEILRGGGALPLSFRNMQSGPLSPRQKGIRQGMLIMMSSLLLVPLVIFLGVVLLNLPGALIPLIAVLTVMGGLLRMLYAMFLEESAPNVNQNFMPPYAPPSMPRQLNRPQRDAFLPPPQSAPTQSFMPPKHANTAEMFPPSGVTDHTTRLLKDTPEDRSR